jgi:hypothetical protein
MRLCLCTILLLSLLSGCSKASEQGPKALPDNPKVVATKGIGIDTNVTFAQLVAAFPELELPFPRLTVSTDGNYHGVPWFPEEMYCETYRSRHPELEIPRSVASRFLDLETGQLDEYIRESPVFVVTAIGKVTRDSFILLIYDVARMEGQEMKGTKIDTTYRNEYKIASFTQEGGLISSHHFGFDRSIDSDDIGCAELLPDLTANVYDNPWCIKSVIGKGPQCRIDHHITILPDGKMKVKTKKYK